MMNERQILGKYIQEYSVRNKSAEALPVYSVTNDKGFCQGYFDKDVSSKDKSGYKIVPRGYFAYNPSRINVGSIACQEAEDRVIVSPLYVVFGVSGELYNPYLMYFLKSAYANDYINAYARGAVRNNFGIKKMCELTLPVPSLASQQGIVEELDAIHAILNTKNEQLRELDKLAQAIFYDMFGDPITNEKGWEVKKIGEVCTLKSGDSSSNSSPAGSLPYVKVSDMNLTGNERYIVTSSTFVDYESNKRKVFPAGTTIFPKRGGAIFTNKKRLTSVEICCDLNTMGVIPSEKLHPEYLFMYFYLLDFSTIPNGSSVPQINNIDIAPLRISLPPLDLQQAFASKITAIEQQKELIRASIAETETLLAARMQHYFD